MQFAINWDDGYVVTVILPDPNLGGYLRHFPLRNFGDREGDAKAFKYLDCPDLTDTQIRMLIKNYNPAVKYQRISGRKFVKQ